MSDRDSTAENPPVAADKVTTAIVTADADSRPQANGKDLAVPAPYGPWNCAERVTHGRQQTNQDPPR